MSELDLGLKVASRRLLWRMGYTTRIDVALRAVGQPSTRGRGSRTDAPEAFTDLDVLGLTIAGGYRVESAIVDCKTTAKGSTGRMFWIRGVADFFAADAAFMVRDTEVSDAARQLSSRLGISALNSADLTRLEELHDSELPLTEAPLSWLFDRKATDEYLHAFTSLDTKLRPLRDFRDFDYWISDNHRVLAGLVEQLRSAADVLDARNPIHLSLFLDCCWLYLLGLVHAIEAVRAAHVSDVDAGLAEYLLGGPAGVSEKRGLSMLLGQLREAGAIPAEVHVDPLPTWYPRLLELVTRLQRRPDQLLRAARLLEVATFITALRKRVDAPAELGTLWDPFAAKLACDVAQFLATTVDLDTGFMPRVRSLLLGEPFSVEAIPPKARTVARSAPESGARPVHPDAHDTITSTAVTTPVDTNRWSAPATTPATEQSPQGDGPA